jgi:hypothetical protein
MRCHLDHVRDGRVVRDGHDLLEICAQRGARSGIGSHALGGPVVPLEKPRNATYPSIAQHRTALAGRLAPNLLLRFTRSEPWLYESQFVLQALANQRVDGRMALDAHVASADEENTLRLNADLLCGHYGNLERGRGGHYKFRLAGPQRVRELLRGRGRVDTAARPCEPSSRPSASDACSPCNGPEPVRRPYRDGEVWIELVDATLPLTIAVTLTDMIGREDADWRARPRP